MKKILYVINADWYFKLHWLERAVYFQSKGYEVNVAMPIVDTAISKVLVEAGIKLHHLPIQRTSMSVLNELKLLFKLNSIIRSVKPSLVHSVTIKPNLYSTMLCRFKKVPLISTYPGLGTLGVSKKVKYSISRKFIFFLLRIFSRKQNNYAFFENNEDLNLFKVNNVLPASRLERVFGAGINLDYFSFSTTNSERGEIVVLFASRLLKNKGLSLLFDAVKELHGNGVNIRLRIAGIFDHDSPFSYNQQDIDFMSRYPFVEWLGKRTDIKELIEGSSVVSLPTTYGEGVPRILIEACAVGRPIITTPLGGCRDICIDGFNGFLVEPNSTLEIISALKKFVQDESLVLEMGANGRELVESKFSNQSVFEQHFDMYKLLLNRGRDK